MSGEAVWFFIGWVGGSLWAIFVSEMSRRKR